MIELEDGGAVGAEAVAEGVDDEGEDLVEVVGGLEFFEDVEGAEERVGIDGDGLSGGLCQAKGVYQIVAWDSGFRGGEGVVGWAVWTSMCGCCGRR